MLQSNITRIGEDVFRGKASLNETLLESITIELCQKDGVYGVVKTKNGDVEIGSKYSEKRHAERCLKNVEFKPSTFYWIFGLNSISYIEEVLKKIPASSFLWIVEPFPEYFYKLGEKFELTFFENSNVAVTLHSDLETFPHKVQDWLYQHITLYECIEMFPSNIYSELDFIKNKDWLSVINKELKEACLMAEMAISTMDLSVQNYFSNFHASLRNQDWLQVQRKLVDKPLIIIGAGPSLFSEYETLREIQGSVHIAVVDNGLRSLISEDIQPDFVLQVDWQKDTLEFYRDVDIAPTTTLVTTAGAYSGVIEHWPGQLLFLQCPQLEALSRGFVLKEVPCFFGTNVGMLAIQFANISHANPACLVGYDMGAPMMTHFHPKVIGLQDIYPSVSRFWSVDKYNYSYLKKHRETITIKDQHGNDMWTALSIEKGRKDLENYFEKEQSSERFVNCSKFSAGFKGVSYKNLSEVVSKFSSPKEAIVMDKHCLNYERYSKFLEEKSKQARIYFKLMEDTYHCGIDLVEIYDTKNASVKQNFLIQEYQKNLDLLFNSGTAWIENLMVEVDRRLIILHKRDNLLLEDLESNKEKLIAKVKQFISHYPSVEKHKQWLTLYLKSLSEKNKEASSE